MKIQIAVLWLAGASIAEASTLNTGQLGISPDFQGGTGPFSQATSNNGPVSFSGAATGAGNESGQGSVYVDWGVIQLFGQFTGSGSTVAGGNFQDTLTVTAQGVPIGAFITFDYSLSLSGNLTVVNNGEDDWSLEADIGNNQLKANGKLNPFENPPTTGSPFGLFTGTATVQNGDPSNLAVFLTGSAQSANDAQFPTGGTATFDLAHSLYWAGISNVEVNGAPVASYTVDSASGTNYASSLAAPEPGTEALALVAVWTIGLKLRRRLRARVSE